jgi:hypothetical protein
MNDLFGKLQKYKKEIKKKSGILHLLLIFIFIFALTIFAGMAKLVDVPDLGSGAARRVGSSPITRT